MKRSGRTFAQPPRFGRATQRHPKPPRRERLGVICADRPYSKGVRGLFKCVLNPRAGSRSRERRLNTRYIDAHTQQSPERAAVFCLKSQNHKARTRVKAYARGSKT